MDTLTLVLVMMTHRGDFLAQRSLPYIDALPLDYPHRVAIIHYYRAKAAKECQKECDDRFWCCRAATRLMLQGMSLWDSYTSAYLMGRMIGRHNNWQMTSSGHWEWIDARKANTEPEPIGPPAAK